MQGHKTRGGDEYDVSEVWVIMMCGGGIGDGMVP